MKSHSYHVEYKMPDTKQHMYDYIPKLQAKNTPKRCSSLGKR